MNSSWKWQIKLYQNEIESVKWRTLFNFLGVDSTLLRNEKELVNSLLNDPVGLIVFDRGLLGRAYSSLAGYCTQWIERGGGIALTGSDEESPIPPSALGTMHDISERDPFQINDLLQRFLPTYSRLHPRLGTRLPGLYSRPSGGSQICEIMNLSPGGAFIRTTEVLPRSGEDLCVNVPLIGLRKELEITSCVVSQVLPVVDNNYIQGIGVKFKSEGNDLAFVDLKNYVRFVIANDEKLYPQITPFSGCRSKGGHDAKFTSAKHDKGRERVLGTIL